jgi:hypothetical protein
MTLRNLTISLLFVYGTTILSFRLWEMGHSILNAFENSIHHYVSDHHHKAQDHHRMTVVDHSNTHKPDVNYSTNYILLFFEVCTLSLVFSDILRQRFSEPETKLISKSAPFFVRPPNFSQFFNTGFHQMLHW